jgi:hypothetical protein
MANSKFNRDKLAQYYALHHLKTDPGTRVVYYLPKGAPAREIRLLEVNELIAERRNDPLEPLDFGLDRDGRNAHTLLIVDVTPSQWERIQKRELALPETWNLDGAISFTR